MSNSQWPPSSRGRDPRQPFGQPPAPPPAPEDLAPPKRSKGAVIAVLLVVALIAIALIGMQFLGGDSEPEATSGPEETTTVEPAPERTGNYIPFEGNGDGIFEIVDHSWSGDQLDLRIRVEVEHGDYAFAVFAFTNETRLSYDPVDVRAFTARPDEPFEGNVTFVMPNADSTIVLTTPSGRVALNALPVKGS